MSHKNKTGRGTIRAAGFSLLEVLVTVVIVSLGLLGLAGLQVTGLRFSNDALHHSAAIQFANEIAECIRANKTAAADGLYTGIDTNNPPSARNCAAAPCTPAEMAAYDWRTWSLKLHNPDDPAHRPPLPDARATVTRDGGSMEVTVTWGSAAAGRQVNLRFSL